jgi:anti-anti-sigma factor
MSGVPARSSDGTRLRLALGTYLGIGERLLPSGEAMVILHGELDLYGVPDVEKAFEAVGAGVPALIVDVRELTFIDSSGVRCLIQASRARRELGSPLICVARGDGAVRHMLGLVTGESGLDIRDASPSDR